MNNPDSGSAELREPHRHTARGGSGGVRVRHTTLERSRARAPSNSNNGTSALRRISPFNAMQSKRQNATTASRSQGKHQELALTAP
ncbi:hypothetical protein PGIGA_G00028760 [Pangasianodon gigas]|uniref:Uncharacterized protein n=1 Tax=Pangasianodon gigas TaxID=30993 RepID=A0ACC5WY55_PANGG|nr:hypothetical protein [Pangasianodon gigas]